ncbi:MAG: ABC transporter permease [Lachnospiraceae bacterium]|nr:ABC transporter permease [Lachnospiraceae bacterium]
MKSKISFFNKTLFWKNVTLYWPLWSVYTLMLLMALPINLLFTYNNSYAMFTMDDKLAQLGHCLSISIYIVLIVGMAVATGILVFGYLYNSRNANMIHALPVDRTQLFGTNVLSGLAFMIVPQIITFVVTVFVCLSEGVTAIEYLGIWLLIMMVTSFIAFAVVTICAFCTGNGFGYLIYLVALNFFSTIISSVIQVVINIFGYGASYGDVIPQSLVNLFSPLLAFMVEVDIYNRYNEEGYFAGIEIEGLPVIVIYFVVAIIMYAVAYVIYKKRHIEHAGDLITVGFVKPIFRWGIGTTCGILLGLCISEVFREIGIYFSIPILILVMLCVGIIFYFAADMLVKKSFKVFQKKNWIQCGMFSVFLVVCFGILYQFSNYYEMYIPKQENVKMAYIDYNYSMHFEGEEVGKVIELHKELLSNKDVYEDFIYKNRYNYLDDIDYQTVSINYILENGISCRRYYDIPLLESAIAWIDKIIEIEKVRNNF